MKKSSVIIPGPVQRHLTFFLPHVSDPTHDSVSICSLISHISLCSVTFQYHSHYTHCFTVEHKSFSCLSKKVLGVIIHHQFHPYFADPFFSFFKNFKLLGIISFCHIVPTHNFCLPFEDKPYLLPFLY